MAPARAHIQRLQPSFRNTHWLGESPQTNDVRSLKSSCALNLRDVFGLEALGALADLKLHKLAFIQRFIPVHLNGREVNEDVFSRLTLNEPIPLRRVKPLHHTLFSSQRCLLLSMKSRLRRRNAGRSRRPWNCIWACAPHKRRYHTPIKRRDFCINRIRCPEFENVENQGKREVCGRFSRLRSGLGASGHRCPPREPGAS